MASAADRQYYFPAFPIVEKSGDLMFHDRSTRTGDWLFYGLCGLDKF
jgi:hypothetical protein